jgi:uncharacterized glyoxalase superfamily protein PhnB
MAVNPVPDGYHTVTPYLTVGGADKVIEFMKEAFDAEERFRMARPDGTVGHAEVQIGDSIVMIADPVESSPMPTLLHLYVDDCDATYERALAAGADSVRGPENQFYGDRTAGVRDSGGNQWWISTHVEDVSDEEMARRAQEASAQQ